MSSAKPYQHHCSKCDADTPHVPERQGAMNIAVKVGRIIVFFVSFGMLCPHIFTEEDEIVVKCEKCGTQAAISPE
jgi:hypothetical protein